MDHAVTDRRRAARFDAPLLVHLRTMLRPANAVVLVNLSAGGALVHSARPLRPGLSLHVQITGGTHVVRVSARVLRCGVAAISAVEGVVYLGAVRFDRSCELPWVGRPRSA